MWRVARQAAAGSLQVAVRRLSVVTAESETEKAIAAKIQESLKAQSISVRDTSGGCGVSRLRICILHGADGCCSGLGIHRFPPTEVEHTMNNRGDQPVQQQWPAGCGIHAPADLHKAC